MLSPLFLELIEYIIVAILLQIFNSIDGEFPKDDTKNTQLSLRINDESF